MSRWALHWMDYTVYKFNEVQWSSICSFLYYPWLSPLMALCTEQWTAARVDGANTVCASPVIDRDNPDATTVFNKWPRLFDMNAVVYAKFYSCFGITVLYMQHLISALHWHCSYTLSITFKSHQSCSSWLKAHSISVVYFSWKCREYRLKDEEWIFLLFCASVTNHFCVNSPVQY